MKHLRLIAFFLLVSVFGCKSIAETSAPFIAAPLIISEKLLPLAYLSTEYQDSLGYWPSEKKDINTFYFDDKSEFARDSLYLSFGFDENEFESIIFSDQGKNLKIDFTTKYLKDGIDSSMNKNNIYYLKATGTLLVYPKEKPDSLSTQVDHINVNYFDFHRNKIESIKFGF